MNFLSYFITITHNSHITSNYSTYSSLFSCINNLLHCCNVIILYDGVDSKICLYPMLIACGSYFAQITPLSLNNEASANVSMYFGIKGPSWTISTACASGSDAIGLGMDMIRSGRIDVCLAGGTDANITGFNIGCYQVLQALTQNFNDAPEKASRPFD